MTIFPEFERQLQELGRRRALESRPAGRRRPGRPRLSGVRWPTRPTGTFASVAIVAVALIVGGIFLLTLHGAGRGRPVTRGGGAPPPPTWAKAAIAAGHQTLRRDASCRLQAGRGPKSGNKHLLSGAPDQILTSIMGVFRTPAPPGQRVSDRRLERFQIAGQGVYTRYARHGVRDGVSYYLIPVANATFGQRRPAHCYAELLAAFRKQVHHLSRREQAAAVSWFSGRLGYHGPQPGVCLVTRSAVTWSQGCEPAADIAAAASGGRLQGGSTGGSRGTENVLILPDAVATVTAHYPAGHAHGSLRHPTTVTHRVIGNLVVFELLGVFDPPALTARSSTGQVLWRTTLPPHHGK